MPLPCLNSSAVVGVAEAGHLSATAGVAVVGWAGAEHLVTRAAFAGAGASVWQAATAAVVLAGAGAVHLVAATVIAVGSAETVDDAEPAVGAAADVDVAVAVLVVVSVETVVPAVSVFVEMAAVEHALVVFQDPETVETGLAVGQASVLRLPPATVGGLVEAFSQTSPLAAAYPSGMKTWVAVAGPASSATQDSLTLGLDMEVFVGACPYLIAPFHPTWASLMPACLRSGPCYPCLLSSWPLEKNKADSTPGAFERGFSDAPAGCRARGMSCGTPDSDGASRLCGCSDGPAAGRPAQSSFHRGGTCGAFRRCVTANGAEADSHRCIPYGTLCSGTVSVCAASDGFSCSAGKQSPCCSLGTCMVSPRCE